MQTFSEFLKSREAAAAAFSRGEPDAVVALSTTDEPASFFGPYGQVIKGAEKVRKSYGDSVGQFGPGGDSRFEVMHSRESGDMAYWAGLQKATIELDGRLVHMELRVTELFRRERGDWKLVHRHADPLQPKL